jgi:hypothetical protein
MLLAKLLAQLTLFCLAALQLGTLLVPDEQVNAEQTQQHERHPHCAGAHQQRPAPRVARIECPQLFEQVHCCAPVPPALALRSLFFAAPAPLPSSPAVDT